jgi:hypothetical protein
VYYFVKPKFKSWTNSITPRTSFILSQELIFWIRRDVWWNRLSYFSFSEKIDRETCAPYSPCCWVVRLFLLGDQWPAYVDIAAFPHILLRRRRREEASILFCLACIIVWKVSCYRVSYCSFTRHVRVFRSVSYDWRRWRVGGLQHLSWMCW